jgi:hypothetical protein
MNIFKYIIFSFFCAIITSTALSVPFEEKNPRDEKSILVPKGARPVLKEEYPKSQLVVDRLKARHRYSLSIPFARAWNTAALTFMSGIREEPDVWNNREVGFAIHNQRLRLGAVKNKEYFQRETAGFPEGRYWPMPLLENVNRTTGYTSSSFVHLMFKQVRTSYSENVQGDNVNFSTSDDKLTGILNAMIGQNQNLSLTAQRNNQNLVVGDKIDQTRIRNSGGISYRKPGEGSNILELKGSSVWSSLTDEKQMKYTYASGIFYAELGKNILPGFDVNAKGKIQLSALTDQTVRSDRKTIETKRIVNVSVSNIASPASFAKLKLNASGIYDSRYKAYVVPDAEVTLGPKSFQLGAGYRRSVVLPDFDELYWQSKSVIVNNSLEAEDFWEAYGSVKIDVITRLKLLAKASYGFPESRLTWVQFFNHVWYPTNVKTTKAIVGEASLELNFISSFNIFANYKYQHYDTPLFEPENLANAGLSFGRPLSGTVTIGGCFWNYQPTQITNTPVIPSFENHKIDVPTENIAFAYLRISKSFYRAVNVFIDGRYSTGFTTKNGIKILDREDVIYYQGTPQAGRIITVGANFIFGGLD